VGLKRHLCKLDCQELKRASLTHAFMILCQVSNEKPSMCLLAQEASAGRASNNRQQ